MADHWLEISSSEIDSFCGESGVDTLEKALNGTGVWGHNANHVHWFILDLGQTYTIKKVRGRSDGSLDPTDVNIYVSDDKENWGDAVTEGITTWQDTSDWVEVDTTDKDGRYIKVEIESTEHFFNWNGFGGTFPNYTIFDAYGDVAAAGETFYATPSDSLNINDNLAAAATYKRAAGDTLSLGDSLASVASYKRTPGDSFSMDDLLALKTKLSLGDSLSVGDGLAGKTGIPLADLLNIADALKKTFKIPILDTLSISDIVSTGVIQRALSDTLTISDLLKLKWKISRGETLSIDDQVLVARVFYLTDTLAISDSLTHQFILAGGLTDLTRSPALIVTKCYAIADDVPKTERLRVWARARDGKEKIIYVEPA